LEEALPEGYSIMATNPECGGMRKQMQAFRETAQGIRLDDRGDIEFVQ
jgi:hypothetical protein